MSRDLDKISENIKKEEKKEDICNIPLSDYVKRLEPHVKQRYLEKISLVGIDPATLIDAKLDPQCLPPIEATDLLCYLVIDTSYYTKKQFKAFKSLEAYNRMVSGFISSVEDKVIGEKFVVIGKVRYSQRMNERPFAV